MAFHREQACPIFDPASGDALNAYADTIYAGAEKKAVRMDFKRSSNPLAVTENCFWIIKAQDDTFRVEDALLTLQITELKDGKVYLF